MRAILVRRQFKRPPRCSLIYFSRRDELSSAGFSLLGRTAGRLSYMKGEV